MGGWSNRIGRYVVSQMDYYYDDIREDNMPLEYYKKQTVQVKLEDLKTRKEKMIDVPLKEIHDFIKDDENGLYYLGNKDKTLLKWLWGKLKASGTKVTTAFKLNVHTDNHYYLNSKLMDEDIVITTKPVEFEITGLEQIFWAGEHGFFQVNK